MEAHKEEHLIIGVGNELRGDDAAGLLVARELRQKQLPGSRVIESTGEAAELLEQMKSASSVFIIDATQTGASAGKVFRFDAGAAPLPQWLSPTSTSGHSMGVVEAIALARTLGTLPRRLIVYAIEGRDFALGSPISKRVIEAVHRVVNQITDEISDLAPASHNVL